MQKVDNCCILSHNPVWLQFIWVLERQCINKILILFMIYYSNGHCIISSCKSLAHSVVRRSCCYIYFHIADACICVQMADAMEMMILSILAPQLHCEWALASWEVALLTSVLYATPSVNNDSPRAFVDRFSCRNVLVPLSFASVVPKCVCLNNCTDAYVMSFLTSLKQAVFIGMMISSSLWGNISDKYGRKTVSMKKEQYVHVQRHRCY